MVKERPSKQIRISENIYEKLKDLKFETRSESYNEAIERLIETMNSQANAIRYYLQQKNDQESELASRDIKIAELKKIIADLKKFVDEGENPSTTTE